MRARVRSNGRRPAHLGTPRLRRGAPLACLLQPLGQRLVLRGLQLAPGQQEREGALGEALLELPHVPGQRLAARGADLRLS